MSEVIPIQSLIQELEFIIEFQSGQFVTVNRRVIEEAIKELEAK